VRSTFRVGRTLTRTNSGRHRPVCPAGIVEDGEGFERRGAMIDLKPAGEQVALLVGAVRDE
jgi:hypothetical protein